MRDVLGEERSAPTGAHRRQPVAETVESTGTSLPHELANETFLAAEYALVVLPNKVHDEADYLRVRRPGRGVALDRAKRAAVWALIAAYRAQSRIDGSLDFAEAAAVAAAYLATLTDRPADHVLVDEGQDLSPSHWQLLRALVDERPRRPVHRRGLPPAHLRPPRRPRPIRHRASSAGPSGSPSTTAPPRRTSATR